MGLNPKQNYSGIYEATVVHTRLTKKKNQFRYRIYTFLLDIDFLDEIQKHSFLFRRNKFSLFSFYDKDHWQAGEKTVRENIEKFAREHGLKEKIGKILLQTNLRVLGYVFNPVSFYFLYSTAGEAIASIAEVGNTFGERKMYFIPGNGKGSSDTMGFDFRLVTKKFFYVSPYIALDSEFDFRLDTPEEKLRMQVDSWESGKKTLGTAFTGQKKPFRDVFLLIYFLKYPLVTVKVIGAIHYQAMILYLKKIPFLRKNDNLDLQREVQVGKSS
jgi:DUF1365 family protein